MRRASQFQTRSGARRDRRSARRPNGYKGIRKRFQIYDKDFENRACADLSRLRFHRRRRVEIFGKRRRIRSWRKQRKTAFAKRRRCGAYRQRRANALCARRRDYALRKTKGTRRYVRRLRPYEKTAGQACGELSRQRRRRRVKTLDRRVRTSKYAL